MSLPPGGPVGYDPASNRGQYPTSPPSGKRNPLLIPIYLVAAALVVVVTIIVTLSLTGEKSDQPDPGATAAAAPEESGTSSATASELPPGVIASASDTAQAAVILSDPTCEKFYAIINLLRDAQKDWETRDIAIAADAWTPEQRAMHTDVAAAMDLAATQVAAISPQTPHRVMRELYEQYIAYLRAYAAKVPSYVPADDRYAVGSIELSSVIVSVCNAAYENVAATRSALVTPRDSGPITAVSEPLEDPLAATTVLDRDLGEGCSQASEWGHQQSYVWTNWRTVNEAAQLPATEWDENQQFSGKGAASTANFHSDQMNDLAASTTDPIFADFLSLGAAYLKVFVASIPSYVPADSVMYDVGAHLLIFIDSQCGKP